MSEEITDGPPTLPPGLEAIRTATGLEYLEVEVGDGRAVCAGDTVKVHYRGWLTSGSVFDRTDDRGPAEFTAGEGQVIAALDEGVVGLKPGGRRRLIVPSDLGYGSKGLGKAVPPYATLILDLELVATSPGRGASSA